MGGFEIAGWPAIQRATCRSRAGSRMACGQASGWATSPAAPPAGAPDRRSSPSGQSQPWSANASRSEPSWSWTTTRLSCGIENPKNSNRDSG